MATAEYDIPAARAALTAIIAAIDACPEPIRVPMLRMFLDRGLDRLESIEDGFYEYLAECAMLAGQNMQDVRLQSLEADVAELKAPEGPLPAELFTEVAIVLAVELAVVGFVHYGVGFLLLAVGQRTISKAARTSLRAAEKEARAQGAKLSALEERRQLLERGVELARANLVARFGRHARFPRLLTQAFTAHDNAQEAVAKVTEAIAAVRRALAESEEAAAKAAAAIQAAWDDPGADRLSAKWRTFLHQSLSETTLQRLHQAAGEAVEETLTSQDAIPRHPAFLSSRVVGMQLSDIRGKRMAVARDYSDLRHYLRSLDDLKITRDERAQDLAFQIVLSIPPLEARQTLAELVRPTIVDGYELALWYEWLATSGMLSVDDGKTFGVAYELTGVPGRIHEGFLVLEEAGVTRFEGRTGVVQTTYNYKGDFYPGILRMSEFQAEYLYKKFAGRYFEQGFSSLPFEYDPAVYERVCAQPKHTHLGFFLNVDRQRRLDEMRLMVVLFFIQFFDRIKDKPAFGVVQESAIHGRDWLAQIPHREQRWDESIVREEAAGESIAGPLDALIAESSVSRKLDIAVAEARLRAAIVRLEQDIWIYHLVYLQDATEPADTPFGQAADDALRDIRAQQTSLSVSYAELKDLVKEQPELLETLMAGFESEVATLAEWDTAPPTFDDRSGNAPRVTGTRPRSSSRWRWADEDAESPR